MIPAPEPLPFSLDSGGKVYGRDGSVAYAGRLWVPEAPVALEFNGLAYAVMMATPSDLMDYATGFAMAEGLISGAAQMGEIGVAHLDTGWIVRAQIDGLDAAKLSERVRARVAESSCGLCGMENLEVLARPLPQVLPHGAITPEAIFEAGEELREHQTLGRATSAAHAAAFCAPDGAIVACREDVGRHNAVDKLIGAMLRAGVPRAEGFLFSTARCSYEIVEKAVKAGVTTLVTISLPTSLAVERARAAGLSLWVLARHDSVICVTSR
ncbi:formate dehydrogenase accessory sulfurtransferase FdhD [Novosphingobium sp. KACC 22771]|uniref:formate dehydrogenase accessory sulfurtransferase FdhD n=1 Tax=Novosphingobium sp. KACC 22771 TaxID=3025670 RepID=UPI002366878E|nr:formate dehydrogenase accessory sulfurtransferase FdhD [Novosphingobium sp. KACC 22771]WDF72795.1 formate dehydrogenase accessory sulfurtransferase FdhD [Novosphingobium sp. KACC 22771]